VDDSQLEPRGLARLFPFSWLAVAGTQPRTRPNRPISFTPSRVEPIAPPPPPIQERPSAAASLARFAVWVLVVAGWLVFAAWWVVVLRRESIQSFGVALGVLASIVVVCAVGMALWTRHNMRIARNGKRGYSSLFIPMRWDRDALGRPIELPPRAVATTAADVRVVMRDGVKVYVAAAEGEQL
jgi:hypothetical protein